MTQPRFAPIAEQHEVREVQRALPPAAWTPHRPGEFRPGPQAARGIGLGVPGPDQGYALNLAGRFADRLELSPHEHADDVVAGAVAIAMCRAALFGRAPVMTDIEFALVLFGYLKDGSYVPADLVTFRHERLSGAAHDYWRQRALADSVPESTLRRTPAELTERRHASTTAWRDLFGATV
jgi:hypothetical protein